MNIELNVTKTFDSVMNFYSFEDDPEPILDINPFMLNYSEVAFRAVNFGINWDDSFSEIFSSDNELFYIAENKFKYKSLFVFEPAEIKITKIKGIEVEYINKETRQRTYSATEYEISKDDFSFHIGGNLRCIPYFVDMRVVAGADSVATVSLVKKGLYLTDSYDESEIYKLRKPLEINETRTKLFQTNVTSKYFEFRQDNGFSTQVAIESESKE